ncbi:MAG: VOC family protein [Actinobacteria bacterium]|mgnify:CR=1 FL=1|nr:MAG: VOC family protein [Actinomycetota bacterium]
MLSQFEITTALPAKDMDRAERFYEDVLGFDKADDAETGTMYESGDGTSFFIYPSSFAGTNQGTAATWHVDDIENVVDKLRDRGVDFEEYDMPDLTTEDGIAELEDGTKTAWFRDTEGNILALTEYKL